MKTISITEKQFQAQVVDLARLSGWLDLVLMRPPRLVFAELKGEKGRIRPEQRAWLEALSNCTQAPESYLWRPRNLGEIQRILKRGAKH